MLMDRASRNYAELWISSCQQGYIWSMVLDVRASERDEKAAWGGGAGVYGPVTWSCDTRYSRKKRQAWYRKLPKDLDRRQPVPDDNPPSDDLDLDGSTALQLNSRRRCYEIGVARRTTDKWLLGCASWRPAGYASISLGRHRDRELTGTERPGRFHTAMPEDGLPLL